MAGRDDEASNEFFSQPFSTFSAAAGYPTGPAHGAGSSSGHGAQIDIGGIDLNSQAEDWPGRSQLELSSYGDYLDSTGAGRGTLPPLRVSTGGRTLGLRAPVPRGATAVRTQSGPSPGVGRGASFPPAVPRGRGTRRGAGSRSTSGRRTQSLHHPRMPAVAADNFDLDEEDDDEDAVVEVRPSRQKNNKLEYGKANWSDRNVTVFCEILNELVRTGECYKGSISKTGYKELQSRYQAACNLLHDKKQLSGKIRSLKFLYQFITRLETDSGLGRNPDGSVNCDDQWWEDNTKNHPELKRLTYGYPCFRILTKKKISGKFYLVDSGYPNRPGYLAPYKGSKYHLPEFRNGPAPKGKEETFNYAHSSLRNVIERSFGVLKMKWRILLKIPKYPLHKQTQIIVACMALHNFVRESAITDRHFEACDRDENYVPLEASRSQPRRSTTQVGESDRSMNAFRDSIANGLFTRS